MLKNARCLIKKDILMDIENNTMGNTYDSSLILSFYVETVTIFLSANSENTHERMSSPNMTALYL